MSGYFFLVMVLVGTNGVSQHSPNPGVPYSWDQCQKAGKFNVQNLSKEFRNMRVVFYCSPTAGTTDKLPQDEDKK